MVFFSWNKPSSYWGTPIDWHSQGGYAQGTETIRPSLSLNGEAGGAQLGRGDPVDLLKHKENVQNVKPRISLLDYNPQYIG